MMTAEQMKGSILQLAMQGKLVEQRPEEGTGAELFYKISRRGKNSYVTQEDPLDIPDNWIWVRLEEVCELYTGNSIPENIKKSKYMKDTEGYPYIATKDVLFNNTVEYNNGVIIPFEEDFRHAFKGSILMCIEGGSAGRKIALLNRDVCFGNKLCMFNGNIEINGFLFYYLQSPLFKDAFKDGMTGIIGGVNIKKLRSMWMPLPPLAEQKRIVAKIEELMPLVEQYAAASTKLNTLNTTFPDMMKKSILQEAVQGKLVPQDPNDEPASMLLKKIAEEKKRLIKEGKIKKQKPLPELTEEDKIFDIPESWEWVRLTDIGEISRGRSQHRPRGDKELYVNGKYPLVQTGDVASAEKYLTEYSTMYNEKGLEQSRMWPKGTLCITIAANIGDVAILDFDACFPDSVVGFSPYSNGIVSEYVYYLLQAFKPFMEAKSTKVAQKNLNVDKLSSIWFPIPPTEEQKRIVNKLDECFPTLHEIHEKSNF